LETISLSADDSSGINFSIRYSVDYDKTELQHVATANGTIRPKPRRVIALLRDYYRLAKPGIVYGNALTIIAGFVLAGRGSVRIGLFIAALLGISLIIAGACVYNNYLDRRLDARMARTRKRALVVGTITNRRALIFASVLTLVGFSSLVLFTNWATVIIVAVGFIDYVALYGWAKRRTVHATLVGSISGAVPLVAGYMAAADHWGVEALLLFVTMMAWQMPHFYGIALYRTKDYTAADLPVMPVKYGPRRTQFQALAYLIVFTLANLLLTIFGYERYSFAVVMTIFNVVWLWQGLSHYRQPPEIWGRKIFAYSLIALLVLSVMLPLGSVLP
jgi:protoheme IX farnesyltransferase